MKSLTLVRHGHAEWKNSQIADFERPLSRRGIAEVEAIAKRLLEQNGVPDRLVASPARRTNQTAEILARIFKLGSRRTQRDEHLYLAAPIDILAVIQATGPRIQHLLIVGHNPGLSELTHLLAPVAGGQELSTGAACTMTLDARNWSQVGPGKGREAQYEKPPARLFRIWA